VEIRIQWQLKRGEKKQEKVKKKASKKLNWKPEG
jgi:hypothetical protein